MTCVFSGFSSIWVEVSRESLSCCASFRFSSEGARFELRHYSTFDIRHSTLPEPATIWRKSTVLRKKHKTAGHCVRDKDVVISADQTFFDTPWQRRCLILMYSKTMARNMSELVGDSQKWITLAKSRTSHIAALNAILRRRDSPLSSQLS